MDVSLQIRVDHRGSSLELKARSGLGGGSGEETAEKAESALASKDIRSHVHSLYLALHSVNGLINRDAIVQQQKQTVSLLLNFQMFQQKYIVL